MPWDVMHGIRKDSPSCNGQGAIRGKNPLQPIYKKFLLPWKMTQLLGTAC